MQSDGSLFSGADAAPVLQELEQAGAAAVGFNCVAADMMTPYLVSKLHRYVRGPLVCKPNAGVPTICPSGLPEYSLDPAGFAQIMADCAQNGATLLGGCCGTTPEHMQALTEII
jgi:5-methyltetrahydrofolate--homocysteine methyltransferase